MAEKLSRDRSSRKQMRTTSGSNNPNLSSLHRQYSSSRGENRDFVKPSLRRRDEENSKAANNYPPLEDYAE